MSVTAKPFTCYKPLKGSSTYGGQFIQVEFLRTKLEANNSSIAIPKCTMLEMTHQALDMVSKPLSASAGTGTSWIVSGSLNSLEKNFAAAVLPPSTYTAPRTASYNSPAMFTVGWEAAPPWL